MAMGAGLEWRPVDCVRPGVPPADVVLISEDNQNGTPRSITIRSRDRQARVTLRFTVTEAVRTRMVLTEVAGRKSRVGSRESQVASGPPTFLQLGGVYEVSGRAGDLEVNFTARGSAETFRY